MILLTRLRRNGTVDMLIVLGDDSVERIKRYDQAEVQWSQLPKEYSLRRPGTIGVSYATDAEQKEIVRMSATDPDWKEKAFRMLTRGFEFKPEKGDHDFGPVTLGESTKGSKQ